MSIAPFRRRQLLEGSDPWQVYNQYPSAEGAWFDASDLNTMFQDSAGTTPAAVDQPVGLWLDKSHGLVAGPELIQNPTYSNNGSGWTTINSTVVYSASQATVTATVAFGQIVTNTPSSQPGYYKISVPITASTGGAQGVINVYAADGATIVGGSGLLFPAGKTAYLMCYSATGISKVNLRVDLLNQSVTFGVPTLKYIPGKHASQATTANKPILRQVPITLVTELVTNGTFDTAGNWNYGTGWTQAAGQATATAATGALSQILTTVTAGKTYKISWQITNWTSGASVYIGFLGGTNAFLPSRASAQTQEGYLVAPINGPTLYIGVSGSPTCTIDNISVKEIQSWSDRYYLEFGSFAKFMQTASMDFSATSKMFVCAGVRKLSDSSAGLVAELSASTAINANAFSVGSGSATGAANRQNWYGTHSDSTPTEIIGATTSAFVAPDTKVLTVLFNKAATTQATQEIVRLNGVAQTLSFNNATVDSGNFGTYPLYIGARSGTTLWFTGWMFGMVIIGTDLTDGQLNACESWVNSKARAY